MINEKFIGVCKTCKTKCESAKKEAYKEVPHSGDHEIFTDKQFQKRLNTIKIGMVDSLISENIQYINTMIEQAIQNIKKFADQTIQDLKRSLLITMMNQKVQITQRLENSFFKLTKLEYQQLTCSELSQIFSSLNKNCKTSTLENLSEKYLKELEKKLKQISQVLKVENQKQSSNLGKSSTQSSLNLQEEKERELDSIDNFFQQTENDFTIDFQDSEKDEKQIDQSIVTIIDKLSEPSFKKKESLPSQSFFIDKKSEKKQKAHPALKDFSSDQEQKGGKCLIKKQSQSYSKKQESNESQLSVDVSMQMKEKDPSKSFINKQQGRYYITVNHLQKQVQKKEKSKFNIELRVVQKIIYRLFKDKKSQKMYKKVKFVAGDQNGIVVCYTNNVAQLKKDCYVVLKDCTLDEFKEKSYEICSNHCEIIKEKRTFKAKIQKSISRFSCMNPLIYSLQKQQSKWPSVLGIAYLDRLKCKSIQLIVKIDEIIEEQEDKIRCYLSDGTAQIYAIISNNALPKDLIENKNQIGLIGSVFFLKKLQAHEGKVGDEDILFLAIGKQNNPVLMKDMQYNDNVVVKNVNQIIKELKS